MFLFPRNEQKLKFSKIIIYNSIKHVKYLGINLTKDVKKHVHWKL